MGLQVFLFSQLEDWFNAFALRIASPLSSAPGFQLSQRDVVLVPKLSYAPVLETSLARRFGVSAGLEFDLPGRFLWSLTSASFAEVQGQAPFQAERLRWTLFQILQDPEQLPAGLAERVKPLGLGLLPRFELATRLAKAFEGYVVNRSDWLQTWQDSQSVLVGRESARAPPPGLMHAARFVAHESWQAWVWREILKRQGALMSEHPFVRFEREVLLVANMANSLGIARITIMGMPGLTMHQMRLFARLGQHMDIRWLVMNPCTSFWDDLPELAKRSPEAFLPETPWLNEQGPALLGLWGKGQRDYLSMLRELETSPDLKVNLGEVSLPAEGERQGVLQDLQTAIGTRGVFPASSSGSHQSDLKLSQTDSSIEVHSCQTITHQLLVLRECLLRRGAGGAELKLSDCMVLCADLELARPAIHHVFGVAQQGGRFAYRITRSPAQRSALASLLLDILNGSQTQFSLEQLSQWLSQTLYLSLTRLEPDEAQNFLSALDDVGFVSNLSIKQGFEASFERLLLGAAMDMPLGRASFGRSPSARDTVGQDVLGRRAFAKLSLQELNRFERVLTLINSIETLRTGQALFLDWVVKLDAWLAEWIEPVQQAPGLETLSEDLLEFRTALARAAQTYPSAEQGLDIDARVFRQCLIEALEGARAPGQLAGALNFVQLGAGLIPPTQLIAVLGMNQNLWPRQSFKDELDLTQAWIRSGDLSGYFQDRAELLDALMAARQSFLVFYQGLDPSDSTSLSPSSQIAELLTTLGVKPIQHVMPIPGSAQRILRLKASEYENLVSSYTERQARMQAETHAGLKPKTQARPARKVIRLREMVDALLDPSKLVLRSWSALLIERSVLAEHEPLDQGVLGDPEGGSQAWFAMEVATRMVTGEMTESVAAAAFANHPVFADGPVAMTMAETSLTLATSLVTKVRRSLVASALPFESRQVLFRLGGFEIQDHVMLGREATGDAMHLVLGRGSLTPNLLVRGYLAHCLVNAVLGPANTSIVCLGKAGETLLVPFDSRSEARAALQAWLDFLEEGLRDPKFFDATNWLKEGLLPNKSRNENPKTGESSEEDSDAGLAFVLTRSAELLWKESLPNPSVLEQRAGRLIEQIRQRLEQSSE